ncbi:hypothetical protein F66182_808 [Fusarium sp. NRRL 66182]|nr:hypothetical protein F66182_808 [Fusarium sp. NRRL 66182]
MSSTTSNLVATITNNLGYDVDIYDVIRPDPNTPGPWVYKRLDSVPKGAIAKPVQTIRPSSQLQAMRTGNIQELNNNYYLQFPVAVMAVYPWAPTTKFTLTSDMGESMVESFRFIKYAQANPSSQVATGFRTALGDKTSQKDAVNAFFQSTSSFNNCTMSTWTTVFAWQAQFTNPWQGTYYLYSLGSSSTSASSAPALVATLTITASADADSAVLTMAGTGNQGTPIVMADDFSMKEQDQGTGNVSVALTPTWLNIAQTCQQGGKTVSSYVISAAFTGSINGVKVTGNINQLAIPSPTATSKNDNNKNSDNMFTLSNIEGLVGLLAGLGMIYDMAKRFMTNKEQKESDAREKATSESDSETRVRQIEDEYQTTDVAEVRTYTIKVEVTVSKVQDAYKGVDQARQIDTEQSVLEQQEDALGGLMQDVPPSDATEKATTDLLQAETDLANAVNPTTSAADRDAAVTEATTDLGSASTNLKTEVQEAQGQATQNEIDAVNDADDAQTKEQEQDDAEEQNEKNQDNDDNNDPSEEVDNNEFENAKPEDPIPIEVV